MSPALCRGGAVFNLGQATTRTRVEIGWQGSCGKEFALGDLHVWPLRLQNAKLANDEEQLVIAQGSRCVLEDAVELRLAGQLNPCFLEELAPECVSRSLPDFDSS